MLLAKAELAAIFSEALAYGFGTLMFIYMTWALWSCARRGFTMRVVVLATMASFMFLLSTVHLGAGLSRLLTAFVATPAFPTGNDGYFSNLVTALYRLRHVLVLLQLIILDLLVSYRSYTAWSQNVFVALVPAAGALAYFATGLASVSALSSHDYEGAQTIFEGSAVKWLVATFSILLLTKIVAFISLVISPSPNSRSVTLSDGQGKVIFSKVVDSGAIGGVVALLLLPLYLAHQNAQTIFWNILSPLSSLSYFLIIVSITHSAAQTSSSHTPGRLAIPNQTIMSPVSPFGAYNKADMQDMPWAGPHTTHVPTMQPPRPRPPPMPRRQDSDTSEVEPYNYAQKERTPVDERDSSFFHIGESVESGVTVLQKVHVRE